MTDSLFPFRKSGFEHELVEQYGTVCLVKRSRNGITHYEVVRLHWEREKNFPNERMSVAHWAYPGSEVWGERGWTYSDLTRARRKYLELAQNSDSMAPGSISIAAKPTKRATTQSVEVA